MSSRSSRHERDRDRVYRSGGKRSRSGYRSPPPAQSRLPTSGRYDDREAGGRFAFPPLPPFLDDYRSSRRDELPPASGSGSSKCFSSFYRERFGSHSPEDYRNLRISQFDRSLSKNDIRVLLEDEFKLMAPFEIKIVRNPEDDERLAYVNFERDNCAKTIRRSLIPRLRRVLGRRLVLDPTGVIRDQEGKYIPDRYNRAVMATERRTPPPPIGRRRSYTPDAPSHSRSRSPRRITGRPLPPRDHSFNNLVEDESVSSRTLFVGNLPSDIRESELRRVFEIYGRIDEVEIKITSALLQTVEQALEAHRCQHNKPVRPGSGRCQIGYGKTQTSSRLYVGGLGPWTTAEMLMREFDRYGAIEELEYNPGESSAYIRFVDIDSACDACSRMKNFELKAGKFITVDYAKYSAPRISRERVRSPSVPLKHESHSASAAAANEYVDATRGWSPTSAGYIATLDDLREQFACTWKGFVTLKKIDYPMGFHRIYGKEHLLQDYLRDDAGAALKLNITQRLKVDNGYYQEIIELSPKELALMIAVDGTPSAERVVQYLQEKEAAGLIVFNECMVNVLPQSPITERLLNFFAPRISVMKTSPTYMLVVLRKKRSTGDMAAEPASVSTTSQPPKLNYKVEMAEAKPQVLQPPPPLPSLRIKTEAEEDRLEQIHQERLKLHNKIKREPSPLIDRMPEPPELNASTTNVNDNVSLPKKRKKQSSRKRQNSSDGSGDNKKKREKNGTISGGEEVEEKLKSSTGEAQQTIPIDRILEEALDNESSSSDADPANIQLEE